MDCSHCTIPRRAGHEITEPSAQTSSSVMVVFAANSAELVPYYLVLQYRFETPNRNLLVRSTQYL
jgi:hypothetical protein